MDADEIHRIFDEGMVEIAKFDCPVDEFISRLRLVTGLQLWGVLTAFDLQQFVNTHYSHLFKIERTKYKLVVFSKEVEKQNTDIDNCYLAMKMQSSDESYTTSSKNTIEKKPHIILGVNPHNIGEMKEKIFDIDKDDTSVMMVFYVDKLKPSIDFLAEKMNDYLKSRFNRLDIKIVSIDNGVMANVEIKCPNDNFADEFFAATITNKTYFVKSKVFQDVADETQMRYQTSICKTASSLFGNYIPPEIGNLIVAYLDVQDGAKIFRNMNEKQKYDIIFNLFQKQKEMIHLLSFGLARSQDKDYTPSNFKDFYN